MRTLLAWALVSAITLVCAGPAAAQPGTPVPADPSVPSVTGFTPASGPVGSSVTISGSDFTGVTAVDFNGTDATFAVDTDAQITATVPDGATSGLISVATVDGTVSSTDSFQVTPTPAVTLFVPRKGSVNSSVTITGSDFTGATAVQFNGTDAAFTIDSDTQITATVPSGATTGSISVATADGTVSGPFIFHVIPASHPVSGSTTEILRFVVVPKATCNPDDPQQPSDELCRFRVGGKFTETTGYLGVGVLGGRVFLDYSSVDPDTGCIRTTGVLKLHVGADYVRGTLAAGSVSCPGGTAGGFDQSWTIKISSGVGAYNTVSGGSLSWTGRVDQHPDAATLTGTADFSGSVATKP